MILLIDNYDSFTFNLVHFLGDVGARCQVWRNDKLSVEQALAMAPEAIVLSPGPCTPNEAGICLAAIVEFGRRIPILGVCLGHQAIGQAYGGQVVRALRPVHGKTSDITHDGADVFEGLANPLRVTRYHSLVVAETGLPACLAVTARTREGEIMGLRHLTHPVAGVQFHPEAVLTESGHALLRNFLAFSRTDRQAA